MRCPRCRTVPEASMPYPARCTGCGATVGFYLYDPPEKPIDKTELALPDDVTCAAHPSKRATEICEGTGNYICALCAVPVGDKTYSADFINSGGLEKLKKGDAFERKLLRPDYAAISYAVLAVLLTFAAPILLTASIIYYFKHLKQKRTNLLYARVTGVWSNVILPIYLILASILTVIGLIFLGIALFSV